MYTVYKLGRLSGRGQEVIFLYRNESAIMVIAYISRMLAKAAHDSVEDLSYQVHFQKHDEVAVIMMTGYCSFPKDYFPEIEKK